MSDFMQMEVSIAADTAARYGVPLPWVLGIIGAESSFQQISRPTWEGRAAESSYGPMQILGSTARDRGFTGSFEQLLDPATGIEYGVRHVAWLMGLYGANFDAVVSAYNVGHADPQAGAGYLAAVRDWMNRLGSVEPQTAVGIGSVAAGLALLAAAWFWKGEKR